MKKLLLFALAAVFISHLFVPIQSQEAVHDPMALEIDAIQIAYAKAMANFKRNRIDLDQYKAELERLVEELYRIISSPEVQKQYVRDRSFEQQTAIFTKMESHAFVTPQMLERYLEFAEYTILPGNLLDTSRDLLIVSLINKVHKVGRKIKDGLAALEPGTRGNKENI